MATTPIDPNARFDRQRGIAKQEQTAANQEAKDAMARRFAAMGRSNSGAAIKSERIVDKEGNDALQKRLTSIQDVQETDQLRRQEIEEGRKYQTSEREAGQGFLSTQNQLGREFTTSERLGSQGFAGEQALKQRDFITKERMAGQDFSKGERVAGQEFSMGESKLMRDFQAMQNQANRTLQRLAMDQSVSQFDRSFAEDQRVTNFNMEMAKKAEKKGKRTLDQKIADPGNFFGEDGGFGRFKDTGW